MMSMFRRSIPAVLALSAVSFTAQAQYLKTHGATLSVGGTGQFDKTLTSDPSYNVTYYPSPGGTVLTTAYNQRQFTTWSAGFVSSLQLHPVPWAGIAINYGFTHYQERFSYNYAADRTSGQTRVTTDAHEFTGGYLFHPKHVPLQPYLELGGGAIGFMPGLNYFTQFRGAGLLETGIDLPVKNEHIGFRLSGRSLYYRAPNFYNTGMSSRGWRVEMEPAISAFYRF